MANLSFIDALSEQKRRSVLTGRPEAKATMDKTLRENAVRRLTTTKNNMAPPVPAIDEVVRGGMDDGAMQPLPGGTAPGASGVPGGISGIQAGVIGQGTADALEGTLAAILGFEKGEQGYIPSSTMPLSTLSLLSNPTMAIAGKAGKSGLKAAWDLITGGKGATPEGMSSVAQAAQEANQGISGILGEDEGISGITAPTDANLAADIDAGDMGASSSPTVLCGELYRQGKLNWNIYLLDSKYGQKLPAEVMIGYQLWAIPLSHRMARSPLLSSIVSPFVKAWAYEMAHRMDNRVKGSVLGKFMSFVGEPFCGFIGRSMNHGLLRT